MIRYEKGSLLDSSAQTLVNTVNCVGVMGKGIALEFKRRYPEMFVEYARMCERHQVVPGVPVCHEAKGKLIVNFPTKDHWKARSRLSDIEHGLQLLRKSYRAWNITSIAVPPLGCGNGGLEWSDVRPLIEKYLGDLPIEVSVYSPGSMFELTETAEEANVQETFAFGDIYRPGHP